MEKKTKAEQIFAENFKKMKRGNLSNFKNDYPTLYNKVIIPSIIKGMELKDEHIMCESCHKWSHLNESRFQSEDGLWFCNTCWNEAVEHEKDNPATEEDDDFL